MPYRVQSRGDVGCDSILDVRDGSIETLRRFQWQKGVVNVVGSIVLLRIRPTCYLALLLYGLILIAYIRENCRTSYCGRPSMILLWVTSPPAGADVGIYLEIYTYTTLVLVIKPVNSFPKLHCSNNSLTWETKQQVHLAVEHVYWQEGGWTHFA